MAVSQLSYIGIGVRNTGAWKRFATDVLGMQVGGETDSGVVYLRMDEYAHRVIVHPSGEEDVLYAGFQAPTRREYEQSKASLQRLGVELVQASPAELEVRRVVDMVRFESGGLGFELSFGPAVVYASPFTPGRALSGFKTGDLGLGHIVLRSTDQDATVRILTEGLGFLLSDYVGTMVFMHCNPRHHTIAIQPMPQVPAGTPVKKMWHFMLETNSLDDVGLGFDAASKSDTPPVTTIGKHMNDHMVSFYVQTPSGFEIEYGWGGRLIDDSSWEVVRHVSGDIWGHKRTQPAQPQAQPAAAVAAR
jgi:2,3-dihydroxybiphenyl 1,2-dioxygenase